MRVCCSNCRSLCQLSIFSYTSGTQDGTSGTQDCPLGALSGSEGPRVPNGFQWTTLSALRSWDKMFFYGMISPWENWVLLAWKVEKEMYLVWGIFWTFSSSYWPPGSPKVSPMVPNEQPSVLWEVKIKYLTMGWLHYGKVRCYSTQKWTMEYLMSLGMFRPFFRL